MKKLLLSSILLLALSLSFTSCRDAKKGESIQDSIENAADAASDAVENAAEATGEAVESAANATGEAAENAANSAKEEETDRAMFEAKSRFIAEEPKQVAYLN